MKIGLDIIDINELKIRIDRSKDMLDKILTPSEIENKDFESIAGRIAAKEAIIKTGYIKPGDWKQVVIGNLDSGEPIVLNPMGDKIQNIQISISHTKHNAIAVAIYEQN